MILVSGIDHTATAGTRLIMNEITPYPSGMSPIKNKELRARFDGERLSSDGGVLLQRVIEKRLGLAARLAGCQDRSNDGFVECRARGLSL